MCCFYFSSCPVSCCCNYHSIKAEDLQRDCHVFLLHSTALQPCLNRTMLTYISFIFLLLPCLLPQAPTPDLGHPSFILFSIFYADSLLIGPVCYFIQGYIIQCSRTNSPRTLTLFFPIKKLTRSLVDCKPDSYKDDCRIVRNAVKH